MKQKLLVVLMCIATLKMQAQNVGIGTAIPTDQLHTTGTIRFQNYGSNGTRVLQIDSAGRIVAPGQVNAYINALNIPDNTCSGAGGITSTLTISGQPALVQSARISVRIKITHAYVGDLKIYLIAPNGQILNLADRIGGNTVNFVSTVFTDYATSNITTGTAPYTGSYRPQGSSAAACLTGTFVTSFAAIGSGSIAPNGNWTIRVFDADPSITGIFNSWELSFNGAESFVAADQANYIPKFSNGNLVASNLYHSTAANSIGINTTNPSYTLDVFGSARATTNLLVGANIGAQGNSNPLAPLSFSTALGNKIAFWGNPTGGHFGMGIQAGAMQFYTDAVTSDLLFGVGNSGSFAENMRIEGGGNVAIGSTFAQAKFHVQDGSVLFTSGTTGGGPATGSLPGSGYDPSMLWYPAKSSFRAGYFSTNKWRVDSMGDYSFAAGYDGKASGAYSVALGRSPVATGAQSVSLGYGNDATGNSSVAMGYGTVASGERSFAAGSLTRATGDHSVALGGNTEASGATSIAIGSGSTASGDYAVVLGSGNASGNRSLALGYGSNTSNFEGACTIGDFSSNTMNSNAANQMSMRFAGGYRLFSNSSLTTGVTVAPGGGSWTTISDRRKKEHFQSIDVESILQKIAVMPVTKWNYKSQPATQQHIGPMAQDFYAAFRLDGIGADTTINSGDIDGVNMAAIQALEKRTTDLLQRVSQLEAERSELMKIVARLESVEAEMDKRKQKVVVR